MNIFSRSLRELRRYPSAVAGFIVIVFLFAMAIYAMVAIPYDEAIKLWRGADNIWQEAPVNVPPAWTNAFRKEKLPETIVVRSTDDPEAKEIIDYDGMIETNIVLPFEYTADAFPNELTLFLTSTYESVRPYVDVYWRTPDGREFMLAELQTRRSESYRISQDDKLRRSLGGLAPEVGLFADPNVTDKRVPLKGTYELVIEGLLFEDEATLDASFVAYGKVHGLAGTDHRRRDLTVALLWGTPVALAFGFAAAVGTSLITMWLAALSVWRGGWVEWLISRLTEVNMILPALPLLIMIGTLYSRSIWVMLGGLVALGIFGGSILTYRSMFLQVKESGYIEAARAYGASSWRIILRYMIPRIVPVLIPSFVVQIPAAVFTEATLAVLGLGDPILPTWGKLLNDAHTNGALYMGHYYWVLQPAVLLMLAGLGFSMLGFALDRVFNPRLRGL